MQLEHRIVYFSPAGTTRSVAEFIARMLRGRGCEVSLVDLGAQGDGALAADWPNRCCLWVGSPVYCDHALPQVEGFIRALPSDCGGFSVPFATWGAVTSGLTLPELAAQLDGKGYAPLGAAKVLTVHSSLWRSEQPLGGGHPGEEDLAKVEGLVEEVLAKLEEGGVRPLKLKSLDYLSEGLKADAATKSLAGVKASMPPRQVDEQRCNSCGRCVEACPAGAVTMGPFPVIGSECVLCLQCVRCCPQGAYPFDADFVETRIRAMAKQSDEPKETRVFA